MAHCRSMQCRMPLTARSRCAMSWSASSHATSGCTLCAMLSGFQVKQLPSETLLALMGPHRLHTDALAWRPPGRTPAEKLALVSKEGVRYRTDWRLDSHLQQFEDTGGILSLRGTAGVTKAGIRRLKKLPESERPATELYGTIRRQAYETHYIQRAKRRRSPTPTDGEARATYGQANAQRRRRRRPHSLYGGARRWQGQARANAPWPMGGLR